jgi:hypothetical protein
VAAKLLLFEQRGGFATTKKADLDHFVSDNEHTDQASLEKLYNSADAVLNQMVEIFKKEDPLLASSAQLIVYYRLVKVHGKNL